MTAMKMDLIGLINKGIDAYNNALPIMAKKEINFTDIEKLIAPLRTLDVEANFCCNYLEVIANRALELNDKILLDALINLGIIQEEDE